MPDDAKKHKGCEEGEAMDKKKAAVGTPPSVEVHDAKKRKGCEEGEATDKKKAAVGTPPSVNVPSKYCVLVQHPYLMGLRLFPYHVPVDIANTQFLPRHNSRLVALQCINFRGAIEHGRMPSALFLNTGNGKLTKGSEAEIKIREQSVRDVFDKCAYENNLLAGYSLFDTIDKIQQEIMQNGPVVSESFRPDNSFRPSGGALEHWPEAKLAIQKGECCCCLIVGWIANEISKTWLVQPPAYRGRRSPFVQVPFDQYDITSSCVTPRASFRSICWDSGPYLDLDGSDHAWRSDEVKEMEVTVSMLQHLYPLFKQMDDLVLCAPHTKVTYEKKVVITLRDKSVLSHSRKAILEWVKPVNLEKDEWKLKVQLLR